METISGTASSASAAGFGSDPRKSGGDLGMFTASNLDACWPKGNAAGGGFQLLDMFSGCGGMSAGFKALNASLPAFRILGGIDIDDPANRSYERNIGAPAVRRDVFELASSDASLGQTLAELGYSPEEPLVLIGCAPCQGFSSHRNAKGESDPRNGLFSAFAQVAARLEPDLILVENVPELLTERYWPVLAHGRRLLEDAGYFTHVGIHNMADFGVPQQRFRALLIASKSPFVPPTGFVPPAGHRTVRHAIGGLEPIAAGQTSPTDPMHRTVGHKASTIETIRAVPKDGGNRPSHVGPDCLRRAEERQGKPAYEDVYGRLPWDRPSITITAYSRNPASGRFVHPEQDRGLSIREAALLQGFPAGYVLEGSLDEAFRQVGNAVPPIFSSYLAGWAWGELSSAAVPEGEFDRGTDAPLGASFSRFIPALKARATATMELIR